MLLKMRFFALFGMSVLFLFTSYSLVLAGTTSITGVLTTSDHQIAACGAYGVVLEFTVSQTGNYSIPSLSPSGAGNWYSAYVNLNPSPGSIGIVILGRDGGGGYINGTLTAGTTYYLHVRGDGICSSTTYPLNYSFPVSGPGIVNLASSGVSVITPAEEDIFRPAFYDGRINDFDVAAPIAIYCLNKLPALLMTHESGLV